MALKHAAIAHVTSVLRLRLCSSRAELLAAFYADALDFRCVSVEALPSARVQTIAGAAGRGLLVSLTLGRQSLELIQFVDHPGRAYPGASQASDLVFQHFAIVVNDMDAAMRRLSAVKGWTAITVDGPQQLPPTSGGVKAFKFRDPEGHPLELLEFAPRAQPESWQDPSGGPFLGIDHSAISVSDSARSIAFYASLGLTVSNRSLNQGPIQARLDHVREPVVEVTALAPGVPTPHLELLCYRQRTDRTALDVRANDVAATCVAFGTEERPGPHGASDVSVRQLLDPDGHRLSIERPAT